MSAHIPGSQRLVADDPDLEKRARVAAAHRHVPIIVYGGGRDSSAPVLLANRLEAAGYSEVSLFAGGLEEWRDEGYALTPDDLAEPWAFPHGAARDVV